MAPLTVHRISQIKVQTRPKRGNEKLIQTIKKSFNRFDLTYTKKTNKNV